MKNANVFTRREKKYILSKEQTEKLENLLRERMDADEYGETSVISLYYDTDDYRLIRKSIEKPEFKEKIRARSYGIPGKGDKVFLEIKRKAGDIGYKRRVSASSDDVICFFHSGGSLSGEGQIGKEIEYFKNFYGNLKPACITICERVAYVGREDELRVTIDYNPRYRMDDLDMSNGIGGVPLLDEGNAILEIKTGNVIPLWLSNILSGMKIYPTSFSKYGEAYKKHAAASLGQNN